MSYKSTDVLDVEKSGHFLTLRLNRPDRKNALNRNMQRALENVWTEAKTDDDVRVVIVTGAGNAFCAGADVGQLKNSADNEATLEDDPIPKFTARQCSLYKPVICAVNGVCAGAGLHFVADSDIVIASDTASFVDTHVNVGQVTALEPIGLLRRMSLTPVLRMVVLGKAERLSAQDALDCQMVSEVVHHDNLMKRALDLAEIIAAVSPAAVQKSLKAVWESMELPLAKAYENGMDLIVSHRKHPDAKEGPAAFLEKRPPVWARS